MKKLLLLLFAILLSLHCVGQVTFVINDFSDEYYGKLYVADTSKVFSEGWIAAYGKKNNKELIKIKSEELTFTLHGGKVKANIVEAPYGEQSVLIYDDFNFDGEKDFALMTGQLSCYHGPSFDIYLFNKGSFMYSESFSRLSNEYCGMFEYDSDKKRIYTMVKSGCCWHQYSEFMVENNEPKAVKIEEYDHYGRFPYSLVVTEQKWNGGKMVERVIGKEIDLSSVGQKDWIPFSFQLENGKWVLFIDNVFVEENKVIMRYAFVDADGKVELEYPNPDENRKFANLVYTENGWTAGDGLGTFYRFQSTHPRGTRLGVRLFEAQPRLLLHLTYGIKGRYYVIFRITHSKEWLRAYRAYNSRWAAY